VTGAPLLAVDLVGAGAGELVVVSQGSSARMATGANTSPVDAVIIGILDSLQIDGDVAFRKE
jgi:carbon dioxide concentrating mechanism protein CcmL